MKLPAAEFRKNEQEIQKGLDYKAFFVCKKISVLNFAVCMEVGMDIASIYE